MTRYLSNVSSIISGAFVQKTATDELTDLDLRQKGDLAAVSLSLLGFLEAIATLCDFFAVGERLDIARQLHQILSERFMVAVEGVFSSIRTSGPSSKHLGRWKLYIRRYAVAGEPLGAMILQTRYLKFLNSCSALQLCRPDQLRKADVLDVLLSENKTPYHEDHDAAVALLELLTEIATGAMHLLDDGSDFLQLGSAWQQRLAFAAKASTLQIFLTCMIMDEEIADSDILVSWLEESMADPVQMADDLLASVVLKSMTIVAKFSPPVASNLSRILPRFIVQSGVKGDTVVTAARSLTYVLRSLSQDALITGLYSLGNVLSAVSNPDRAPTTDFTNGTVHPKHIGRYSQQSLGSAISLGISGEEETAAVYGNVVRAIVTVAKSCQDEKIIALAQTMLLQKLEKISMAVDLHIVNETARLALAGGPTEFKALLRLYARLGHQGVGKDNDTLLATVSELWLISLMHLTSIQVAQLPNIHCRQPHL